MAKVAYYVVFFPENGKGVYDSWAVAEQKVSRVSGAQHLGFWRKSQAEKALPMGYEKAREYRAKLKELGEDRRGD